MNFYNISQLPQREQTAQHFHSSLEEPSLENVQAQLQVARQRNYQLALSYFQNKYGSGEVYNQYVESHGLEGLGAPPQQQFDLRQELERQAEQIRLRQTKKIQQKRQGKGNVDEEEDDEEVKQESRIGLRKGKARTNIWTSEKPKEAQKSKTQVQVESNVKQEFYEVDVGREKEGNFISDFKNYLANKKRLKQQQESSPKKTTSLSKAALSQSFQTSQLHNNASSLSQNKSRTADAPKYEEELVRKMIRDIAGKCESGTRVQKLQLMEYLSKNHKIVRVLGVTPEEVGNTVMALPSRDPNLLSFNEVLLWVFSALGKGEEAKKLRAQAEFEAVPQGCMLSRQLLSLFEGAFRSMDRHGDLLVRRSPFIAHLTADPLVKRSLNLPAVFEPEYERHVSLRRVFQRMEMEALLGNEEEKKAKEFLSWGQFMSYFQSGHKTRSKYDLVVLLESLRTEEKFGLSLLPDAVADILGWAVKRADKGEELLNTADLLAEVKLHRDYEVQKFTFLKGAEEGSDETFEEVLARIKDTAHRYLTPKEFLEYFSTRGKPQEQYERDRATQQAKNLSAVKVTFLQNGIFPQADRPDGYDSDPQTYNASALQNTQQDPRKSQKQFRRFKATAQSFLQPQQHPTISEEVPRNYKLTVPQPFSFDEREKERQAARAQLQHSPEKNSKQAAFRAQAVPAKVTEVGLFHKMMEEQHKRNEERKKCSMIMTLANEKPFSFENRKPTRKTKQERQEFVFRAKPIPWFCSVDLLKQKQQEEILRNQRIAKVAQENLAKAKLPPRMEKDFLQKEAKKMQENNASKRPASSQPRARDPPDFNRLHRQFEEALQRKRKENRSTQVQEFKFASNLRPATAKAQPDNPPQEQHKKAEPSSLKSNVDIFAQSTAKFTQQVQKRREEMEQKRKDEAQRKKEEEQRAKIDQQLKQKVQQAARRKKQGKQAEDAERRKEQNNRLNNNFQEWKKERIEKGRQQPLLIDRVSKRDEKIEKMKKLYEISQTLIKNGIKGKEHDHYFKREELLLLQDYKALKDQL